MKLPAWHLVFIPVVLVGACSPCGNQIEKSVASPDGAVTAVAFERDCGATTAFATHVSVLRSSQRLGNSSGNTFIIQAKQNVSRNVDLAWIAPRLLRVTYNHAVEVFRKESRVGDVLVEYAETRTK